MKLKPRLKGLNEVKASATPHRKVMDSLRDAEFRRNLQHQKAVHSPITARDAGMGYQGPDMEDKGHKDGSCNRTACQMPLKGKLQFWMPIMSTTSGRNYYCADCERAFREWDEQMVRRGENKPGGYGLDERGYRCRPDEGNEALYESNYV